MVLIILSFFILCFIYVRYSQTDNITRFIAYFFLFTWCISLSTASLTPFGFFEIKPTTFFIIMCGVLSFIVGLCVLRTKKLNNNIKISNNTFDSIIQACLNNKFIILFILAISVYETKYALASLAFAEIYKAAPTSDVLETKFVGDKLGLLVSMYVMTPLLNFLLAVYIYAIYKKIKVSKLGVLVFIYYFCIYGIINGGRGIFATIAFYILTVYLFTYGSIPYKKLLAPRKVSIIIFVGLLLFTGMSLMTAYRIKGTISIDSEGFSESAEVLAETPARYVVVPIELFNYSIENDYVEKFGGYKYGRMTFSGFDLLLTGVLRKLGFDISSTDTIIEHLQENWILCSNTNRYNYAYTGFFYSYMDLGIFGVVIFPFILGFSYRYLIIKYNCRPSVPLLCVNCFIFIMMFNSFFTNKLHNSWAVFYILVLLIWDIVGKYKVRITKHHYSIN